MGHTNRCPICFNMYRFNIKIGDKVSEVLIDKYDLDVLLGIAKLHRDGKPITVTDICTHINMGFGETNDTIKRLRKLKLVANAEYTGTKQIRGKRKFTALGYAVVIAYESNIYGMPINSIPAQELKANTRLI